MKEEDYLEKYFTEEGVKALNNRLEALSKIYVSQDEFPAVFRMLGFPPLKIHSKAHLEGMIDNMVQILNKKDLEVKVQ